MHESIPWPLGPLAAILALLLRLCGVDGGEIPVALGLFTPAPPQLPQSDPPELLGMHSMAILTDRSNPRDLQDQCDVELLLPGAESDHRVACDLPLAGIHHHRLRVVQPGRGHVFLPGRCPKQLRLPPKTFPRLLTADPADIQSPEAIRARCGPPAGVLRRR